MRAFPLGAVLGLASVVSLVTPAWQGSAVEPPAAQQRPPAPPAAPEPALPESREITSALEAERWLREHPEAVILDVRTPEEFADGHLEGAELLDVQDESFDARMRELPRDRTYFVHCRSGSRSATAAEAMAAAGFRSVVHFKGGMTAWTDADLPVVRDR